MGRPRGRPREYADRIATGLRVPVELYDRLADEADAREVSLNWLCCRLLGEAIENLVPVDELVLTRRDRPKPKP